MWEASIAPEYAVLFRGLTICFLGINMLTLSLIVDHCTDLHDERWVYESP